MKRQAIRLAKGALYHYFPNKLALGYAVVDELLMAQFKGLWTEFSNKYPNPLTAIQQLFLWKANTYKNDVCFKGCLLNNLNQEMAAIDRGFHERLERVMASILKSMVDALEQGQRHSLVRDDLNPVRTAMFIMASYQGIIGTAKCMQAPHLLGDLLGTLNDYIDTLRTPT